MATIKKEHFLKPIQKPNFQSVVPPFRSRKTPADRYDCPDCHGSGTEVDPNAYCDPVEGYKFARRINCSLCNGLGHLHDSYYQKILKEKIIRWKKLENIRKKLQKDLKIAVSKLTKEEFELIEKIAECEWCKGIKKSIRKLNDYEIEIIISFYIDKDKDNCWPSIKLLENKLYDLEKG